jgi:hypothetical protein
MKDASAVPAAREHAAERSSAGGGGAARSGDARGSLLSLGSAIGNRRLGQALHSTLRMGGAGDAAEREAERAADRAVGAAPRGPADARPSDAGASLSAAPPLVHEVLGRPGEPLRHDLRAFMEGRLGGDFGDVRVHTDADAARSARAVGARAYAVGPRVVFGPGEYAPGTAAGRRLVAHELAHVRQGEAGVLRRATYETRGTTFTGTNLQSRIDPGYWISRTLDHFALTVDPRMNADPEERDAVLAAVWALPPPTRVTSTDTRVIPIAPRPLPAPPAAPAAPGSAAPTAAAPAAPPTAPALAYRVTFTRPAGTGAKPGLELAFVNSGAGTVPVAAPAAPAAYQPTQPGMSFSGFPAGTTGNDFDAYFATYPQEHRALFQWLENTAPATFDQVVTTETRGARTAAPVTHRSVLHARGTRTGTGSSAGFSGLVISLVSQGTADAVQTVASSYRDRDAGDWRLEQLQARTPAANRLGTVSGLGAVPAAELPAVKLAVGDYFDRSTFPVRNAEVDAQIPIGSTGTTVLYTFVYGAANDVAVTRVGPVGTGTGQVDVNRVGMERVRGFPGRTAANSALRSWWTTRYPQGGALPAPVPAPAPPQGTQPDAAQVAQQQLQENLALMTAMEGLITAGIASAGWFDANWGIEVLDAAGTATRLDTLHHVPAAFRADTIDFAATDLRMLELALQTLTDGELTRLRGVKLGRKTASLSRNGATYSAGGAGQYGVTLMDQPAGGTRSVTVLYFAPLYANNDALFTGGTAANALPAVVMNLLHELGHATDYQGAGPAAAFNAWRAQHPQTSPTWYAASGPGTEFFPEAFALYHSDPRWLCANAPLVYAWFDELARTGTPPAATAQLTPPATCP